MSKGKPYPHERRLQRLAFVALAAAAVLSFIAIAQGRSRLFGADLPLAAPYGVAALGALLGVAAIVRRAASLVLAACAGLILGALPAALVEPGFLAYAVGLALGAALLAVAELVHMMTRYEAAHKAVEEDGLPEAHLDRVTDEALATLSGRLGLALALAGAGLGLAYALRFLGPAQWRDALETTAPLGVALTTLALVGAGGLMILFRGARMPWRRSRSQETASDAAE